MSAANESGIPEPAEAAEGSLTRFQVNLFD
jgi:hypothetical protein